MTYHFLMCGAVHKSYNSLSNAQHLCPMQLMAMFCKPYSPHMTRSVKIVHNPLQLVEFAKKPVLSND